MNKLIAFLFIMLAFNQASAADRIKDMVSVSGVRDNQLVGYHLKPDQSGRDNRQVGNEATLETEDVKDPGFRNQEE